MPVIEATAVVSTTKAIAAPAPASRLRANARTDRGLPPGSKLSFGSNIRQMPVNDLSKVSMETL